ncbi:hypothetical protein Tco_0098442 [Tanacetum coccineum]
MHSDEVSTDSVDERLTASEEVSKQYHAQKMKPKSIAQARRNMIKYLKNQGNFKISQFKGMSYNDIRPIFEKSGILNPKYCAYDAEKDTTDVEGIISDLISGKGIGLQDHKDDDDEYEEGRDGSRLLEFIFYLDICSYLLNLFYLRKDQRIKPTLYDGVVISKTHVVMPVIDDEETLILEEESRSKVFEKTKDPETVKQNISHKPIDYEKLNRLTKDFGKRFTPQQELSAEQAFWLRISNPSIEPSYTPPVIVDVPSELHKVCLVNASLKTIKFHLTQFDYVVKKRTTPSALEEG